MCGSSHSRSPLTSSLVFVPRIPACPLFRYQGPTTRSFSALQPRFNERWLPGQLHASHNFSSTALDFEADVRLLQGVRRPSTVKSYDQKSLKFEAFTSQVQDDAGASRMCALPPASSQTVVTHLGYLLDSDTISAKSLQPYLSAINTVHNDIENPPPVCGHLVKLTRKGFPELHGSSMLQPQQDTVFPEHMLTIVHHPHLECPQFKTIRATTSTSSRCVGKYYVTIETRTSTGPLTTILCRGSKIQVLPRNDSYFSSLSSTFQRLLELNGHRDLLWLKYGRKEGSFFTWGRRFRGTCY